MPTQPKTPAKSEARPVQAPRSSDAEVDAFLAHLNTLAPVTADGRGRLIFAMDATMSRQPTWDLALGTPGRHVPRRQRGRWTGCAAGLFPWFRRNPRQQMGQRPGSA